tara:strand:+ start:1787 stop:1927 length:141 start_codon:yes stop_codon:yes gene_type:complete
MCRCVVVVMEYEGEEVQVGREIRRINWQLRKREEQRYLYSLEEKKV